MAATMASGTAAGCVSAITRVASGRPRCAREDFRPATPCDTKRARHATRGGRAWRTPPRAVASPTANTAVSTFRDREITGDESDEALVKTRVAREGGIFVSRVRKDLDVSTPASAGSSPANVRRTRIRIDRRLVPARACPAAARGTSRARPTSRATPRRKPRRQKSPRRTRRRRRSPTPRTAKPPRRLCTRSSPRRSCPATAPLTAPFVSRRTRTSTQYVRRSKTDR